MKLVVTIPALNEEATIADVIREIPRRIAGIETVEVIVLDDGSRDRTVEVARAAGADLVISHARNQGLAAAFRNVVEAALARGADIILNTDADNHYDQSRIGELVKPIVDGRADVVIGGRMVEELQHMPWANKYGNLLGSRIVSSLAGLPSTVDASTGFRAYSREAALRMHVLTRHTYTHETLIQAADQGLTILEVPIKARPVARQSRLISSVPKHIVRSLIVILRVFTLYKPLRAFGILGSVFMLAGLAVILRFVFLYFFSATHGAGHIQSLILASALLIVGFQVVLMGLLASAIGWNRKFLEEILYRLRKTRNQQ